MIKWQLLDHAGMRLQELNHKAVVDIILIVQPVHQRVMPEAVVVNKTGCFISVRVLHAEIDNWPIVILDGFDSGQIAFMQEPLNLSLIHI